jgi:YD repeat-containing protein
MVTYPYGGHITYTYQGTEFDLDPLDFTITTTVATKTVSGPDSEAGTWTYTYDPGRWRDFDDPSQRRMDLTTVSGPEGTYRYFHYGYTLAPSGTLWQVGLLHIKEVYQGSALLEQVVQDWGTRLISNENYWHGRDPARIDNETYAPVLLRTVHHRQGTNYITEHSGHDGFGNPHTIVQSSNLADDPAKITHLTYYIDTAKWIVHQLEDETIEGIGTIDRSFDENGDLRSEVRYGVATTYTYTPQGDLATRTDARGNTVTYSDHHRGIAQREEHPEEVVITRVVNNTGTVASETDGRGNIRRFTYDGLNRLTGITFPIHAPVEINWSATGKTLTRGNLREAVSFDGFGRPIRTERSDTATHTTLTQTLRYDALGRKIFESYPNSTQGVIYTYDVLGRLRRLEHPDGTFKTYDFGTGGNQVTETDERGHSTTSIYRAYGAPDNQPVLTWLEAPEDVLSVIERNSIGLVTTLWQGSQQSLLGYQRTYSYDEHLFLVAMKQPETGTTVFGRDAVGNMISRQMDASDSTHYQYDGLNRLIRIDYPETTPDVTQIYDANGNIVQSITADAAREAVYDENDNLTLETLTIGGHPFTITSTFDSLDAVSAITYPSGRTVTYAPDALGRPTQALPYVTGVTYHPSGQIQQMQYANGQITESELNDRLWIHRLHAHGVSEVADLGYHYDPTGNVSTINDAVNPLYNRQLGYDKLNRLVTADGAWGSGTFRYGVRGDIVQKTLGSSVTDYVYNGLKLVKVNQNL